MIKLLSEEEIQELLKSEYIVVATEQFVYFSAEFKNKFYEAYKSGKKPKRILKELGINTDIIGAGRIHSIKQHIMKEAAKGKGFKDLKNPKKKCGIEKFASKEMIIKELQAELAYANQEIEFLKKLLLWARKERSDESSTFR